jgi:hypothetical protein
VSDLPPQQAGGAGVADVAPPVGIPIELQYLPERPRPRLGLGGVATPPAGRDPLRGLLPRRPDVEDVFVRMLGQLVAVPVDASAKADAAQGAIHLGGDPHERSPLDEFVEVAYVFRGWPRVRSIHWQLRATADAAYDPVSCAQGLTRRRPLRPDVAEMAGPEAAYRLLPFPTPSLTAEDLLRGLGGTPPSEWALTLARYLEEAARPALSLAPTPERRRAASKKAALLAVAVERAATRLQQRLLSALREVEREAAVLALQRLAAASARAEREGDRLLPELDGKPYSEWRTDPGVARLLPRLRHLPLTPACETLHSLVRDLRPLAQAVTEAQLAIIDEVLSQLARTALRATAKGMALPGSAAGALASSATWVHDVYLAATSPRSAQLRQRLADAQGALARRVAPAAARFPVLLRFGAGELETAAVETPGGFALSVHHRIERALDAAATMRQRFSSRGPLSRGGLVPLKDEPERVWARGYRGTVWEDPRLIDGAVRALGLTPDTLGAEGSRRMLAAVEAAKDVDRAVEAVSSGLAFALSLSLHVVCPPAGFALDAALGVADVVAEHDVYQSRSAEYYCALDPADAFAQVEPSMLPFVLALASVPLAFA